MPASPDALRIGETFDLEAKPVDESGHPTFIVNETWNFTSPSDAVEFSVEEPTPRVANCEAIEPGSVTIRFTADDLFADPITPVDTLLRVLDAERLIIRVTGKSANVKSNHSNGVLVLSILDDSEIPTVSVAALPVDARFRERDGMPDYSGGLTSIGWSSQNGRILFDTGGGPNPTASGTLSLDLVINDTGDDGVTVTAVNSLSETITGQLTVKVLGSVTVSVEFTETP